MSNEFESKKVTFSLKDVGSAIIDQLATDVHTTPGSILRELVKNAYDSYLDLPSDITDNDDFERSVVISRGSEGSAGKRFLQVADRGVGLSLSELKAFVQISISPKTLRDSIVPTTGFRGLGTWAMVGGGSEITIISKKVGGSSQCRLVINVNEIYDLLGPNTTLEDILNNPACVSFGERNAPAVAHGTTVQIKCDGPSKRIKGHELNRLYPYTTQDDDGILKDLVVRYCPLPYSSENDVGKLINKIYRRVHYIPTPVILDGDKLERVVPPELSEFRLKDLEVKGSVLAVAWSVEHPTDHEVLEIDDKYLVGGPSVQLTKYNVPIGAKGLHSDTVRKNMPSWYLGEVHILSEEVQPDANGDGLRGGTASEIFVQRLHEYYEELEKFGESKSKRETAIEKLEKGLAAADEIDNPQSVHTDLETAKLEKKVIDAVEKLDAKDVATIDNDRLQDLLKKARKQFKKSGLYDRFSHKVAKANKGKNKTNRKKKPVNNAASGKNGEPVDAKKLQYAVGLLTIKLKEFGLVDDQIEAVIQIVSDLVN